MREKRPRTRRRTALLRAGLLAAAAAAFFLLSGYGYTPEAARQKIERSWLLGNMEVIQELGELNMGEGCRTRGWLLGNEKALLLCAVSHRWNSGWQPEGSMPLDCSGEAGLFGGVWQLSGRYLNGGGDHVFLFGRVTDPAIVRVELAAEIDDKSDGKPRIKRTWWNRAGDGQDFCMEADWAAWYVFHLELVGYDAEGKEVCRVQGEKGYNALSEKGDGGHP